MSAQQKEILFSITQDIKTPDGYASNIFRWFDMKYFKLTGLKSHDNHVLLQDIFPLALRSNYPSKDVMEIVTAVANFFKKICYVAYSDARLAMGKKGMSLAR